MIIGAYFDLSDLYHRVNRRFGRKLNFSSVLESFKSLGEVVTAHAYGIQIGHEASSFVSCLNRLGFVTHFKRPEIIRLGDHEIKRANWELQIGLDVVQAFIPGLDVVILGTGSARMLPLVEYIRDCKKRCYVFGVGIEKELKRSVDVIIEVTQDFLE